MTKKAKKWVAPLLTTLLLSIFIGHQAYKPMKPLDNITVLFPTVILQPAPKYLDVTNTENVYEYYLLENLAVGLLRDDLNAPDGFVPLLARAWIKKQNNWEFSLRKDLKWSDGSPITVQQIGEHFKKLSKSKSRHLKLLYTVTNIEYENEKGLLRFKFNDVAPDSFLNELALADAVLTHPHPDEKNNWAITSGPYILSKLDENKKLFLQKNTHYNFNSGYPDQATLYFPEDMEKINDGEPFDLSPKGSTPFTDFWMNFSNRFSHTFNGSYNSVYFFYFTSDKWTLDQRAVFTSKVAKVFEQVQLPEGFKLDSQMVATGMPERINYTVEAKNGNLDLPITVNVLKNMLHLPGFEEGFKKYFGENVTLVTNSSNNCDVDFTVFLANQKESLGNWSFLTSGPLKQFSKALAPMLDKAVKAPSKELRIVSLKELNKYVIDNHLVAPVMWGQGKYYHSDRITLKNWNPFDLRMRLYLIERL